MAIFSHQNRGRRDATGFRPEVLINVLQCTGRPGPRQQRTIQCKTSTVSGLRNAGLGAERRRPGGRSLRARMGFANCYSRLYNLIIIEPLLLYHYY